VKKLSGVLIVIEREMQFWKDILSTALLAIAVTEIGLLADLFIDVHIAIGPVQKHKYLKKHPGFEKVSF
jgi:hypothetical protein